MLVKPELEKLLPKVENRYTLSITIAKRVRQLLDGAQPMVECNSPNLVTIACEELAAGQIVSVKGQVKPYVPLRPEIEAARLAAKAEQEQANMAEAVKDAIDQAAGIEPEQQMQADELHLINENLITISDEIGQPETADSDEPETADSDEPETADSDEPETADSDETVAEGIVEADDAETTAEQPAEDDTQAAATDETMTEDDKPEVQDGDDKEETL